MAARRWRAALEDGTVAARFLTGLPAFRRRPLRPGEARERVRARLAHQETDFLALVARAIYGVPTSPYRRLRSDPSSGAACASQSRSRANPSTLVHFFAHSNGSRGPRTPVPLDLAFVREHAVNRRLSLEARGGLGWHHADVREPRRPALKAARAAGLSLEGARFTLTGEPLTAARLAAVAGVGAEAAPDDGCRRSVPPRP